MYIDISQRKWRKNGQKIISYKSSRILFGNKGSGSKKEEVTFSGKFSFSLILDFSFPDLSLSILSDKSSSSLKRIWSINSHSQAHMSDIRHRKKALQIERHSFHAWLGHTALLHSVCHFEIHIWWNSFIIHVDIVASKYWNYLNR